MVSKYGRYIHPDFALGGMKWYIQGDCYVPSSSLRLRWIWYPENLLEVLIPLPGLYRKFPDGSWENIPGTNIYVDDNLATRVHEHVCAVYRPTGRNRPRYREFWEYEYSQPVRYEYEYEFVGDR